MERSRTVAGSPVRDAAATWAALTDLIAATLVVSEDLDGATIHNECEGVAATMSAIVAANCLQEDRLTLVAAPVYARLYVATGGNAFDAEADERLDAIPGGRTAVDWMVYVDPPPLLVDTAAAGLALAKHFVVGKAPKYIDDSDTKSAGFSVDLDALRGVDLR
jgi:hypothetical protein